MASPAVSRQQVAYLARQPIFDRDLRCVGYELLARGSMLNFAPKPAGDDATRQTIDHALHLGGLAELTGGRIVFINFTQALLEESVATLLPPHQMVVEILETVRPTPAAIQACHRLKQLGYRIAVDDFFGQPELEPFVELADIVKLDFLAAGPRQRAAIVDRLSLRPVQLLAEKLETREEFHEARDAGFALFQGFFFAKPQMIERQNLAMDRFRFLQFLQEVTEPVIDFARLEKTVRAEPALAVRLLSYLNSAGLGLSHRIESIGHALTLLGEEQLRRWVSVFALSGLTEDQPSELARLCLVRGQMCESLAKASPLLRTRAFEAFLVGLLSAIDAAMGRPLSELLRLIPLTASAKAALLGAGGPMGDLRRLVLAHEQANWTGVDHFCGSLGLTSAQVAATYQSAVLWADSIVKS